jgi:glycosyltransferase involved in cell wall biosynthesis
MAKILSVVIPTYNMEAWLPRCLDSVLIDGILGEIEIIVVNDGSTDSSLAIAIANSYKKRFPEALMVIDKQNGHYGSCVNVALAAAAGTYFRILDADDRFAGDAFVRFVAFLQHCAADMVVSNFSREYLGGGRKIAARHARDKYFDQLFFMHGLTYRTEVLRNTGYRQLEGIAYTDTEYCFYPLATVKSRVYFDEVLYLYTIGREGQTVNDGVYYKNREQARCVIQRMMDYLREQEGAQSQNRDLQYTKFVHAACCYFTSILTHPRNETDEKSIQSIDAFLRELNSGAYHELGSRRFLRILRPVRLWRKKSVYIGTTKLYMIMLALQKLYCRLSGKDIA